MGKKVLRKIIEIDRELCDGCGQCILACAEGSLAIIDGKAEVISDNLCDGLGACLGECPQGALTIVEREAEEFDEAAVEEHLAAQGKPHIESADAQPCPSGGCPSARLQAFSPPVGNVAPPTGESGVSALSHWPVQITLIPPTAPFLQGADLLVVADCVPIAFPSLHQSFMQGKSVMVGCPKLDDAQAYVDKFQAIFSDAGIRRITTVMMEVPCCSGLASIIRTALSRSGQDIPLEEVTISTRGEILQRQTIG